MKKYLKDRRFMYFFATLLFLIIGVIWLAVSFSSANKEIERLNAQRREMLLLKDEFIELKAKIDAMERKTTLTKISGVIPAVEEVFSSLGLRNRIKAIKPLGNKEILKNIEEDAEVSVEKISMNEMVNLFYKIENAPMLLVLKKANIKTSFDKPDHLNLTLVISLVREK